MLRPESFMYHKKNTIQVGMELSYICVLCTDGTFIVV